MDFSVVYTNVNVQIQKNWFFFTVYPRLEMKVFYRISSIVCLLFIFAISQLIANNDNKNISKEITSLLGSSSEGTEFFLTFHPCWEESFSPQNKILIYVSSAYKTNVSLDIPGKDISRVKECLPNNVIVFDLTSEEAQCYRKTAKQEPSPNFEYPGYGIIIRSEKPVVCYGLNTSKTTSEGFLVIPKTALGTSYIVSSYNSPTAEDTEQFMTSYTSIVGVYPETEVTITIGGSKNNFTDKPNVLRYGSTKTITLQTGEVYQIGVKGNYNDLTGTTVQSSKPVAVISGSYGTNVPSPTSYCGYLIEQDIPISAWGNQYQVLPFASRQKPSIVRVMASEPNTMLYINGYEWATVETVGGESGKGFIEFRAQAEGESELNPITISANNKIAVTQFNTGADDDGITTTAPFQIALTPVSQYQNAISWTIPNNLGEAVCTNNYVNICYITDDLAKIPDDIMFGQSDGTSIEWRKLADVASPGKTIFDDKLPKGQFRKTTTIKLYNPAFVYYLKGINKLAAYCYGSGSGSIYGYSTISNFKDLSKADIYKPTLEYDLNCSGKITGTISDEPINDASLRTNLKEVDFINAQSYNVTGLNLSNDELISGISDKLNFTLNVIDRTLKAKAVLYAYDCAGNDTTFVIEYNPFKFITDKRTYEFGEFYVNSPTKTITCEFTNQTEAPIILDSFYLKSKYNQSNFKFAGFTIDNKIYKENGGSLPELTLNSGDKISFDIIFDPASIVDYFIDGKTKYLDSIGIKAYSIDNSNKCQYTKYMAELLAYVSVSDTLPPTSTASPCCCSNTAQGTVTDEPINDPANCSHLNIIQLVNKASFNCTEVKYDKTLFVPGKTNSIDWAVNKIDPDLDGRAVILFADRAGNETIISIDMINTKIALDAKTYNYGLVNKNSNAFSRKQKVKNLSNKDIVLDSIILVSNDHSKALPKSGFIIDPTVYKSGGGKLPNLILKQNEEFEFNVIFDTQSIQDEIANGAVEFRDSIGFKAEWNSELNIYCYTQYLSLVKAEIEASGIDDANDNFGIIAISPNPANNSSVNITYKLENNCKVGLTLYNTNGLMISDLLNSYQSVGDQTYSLPVGELPAGVYFIELKAGKATEHKSFVIVK